MSSPVRFIQQAAAIPYRENRICLVTSSSGKRWVIPKGMMEAGKSATEIALQEAWEEAGLLGSLGPAVGTYQYEKYGGVCLVTVFLMRVQQVHDSWPEAGIRRRSWFGLDEALDMIDEEGLREIIRHSLGDPISALD